MEGALLGQRLSELDFRREEEIATVREDFSHTVILGAGASRAAFPQGDANGKRLPLMNDLVDVVGLDDHLSASEAAWAREDFEAFFSSLCKRSGNHDLIRLLEGEIRSYFSSLQLPETSTLYDQLVLSLRPKDLLASFNWDPLLDQALCRNAAVVEPPGIVYLHGNAAVGYCEAHRVKGSSGRCPVCGSAYTPSRLVYPVTRKNYHEPLLANEWRVLENRLQSSFLLTIFGYRAPETDVEARELMRNAWGSPELGEVELIDIVPPNELSDRWQPFIFHEHHRTTDTFADSIVASHPRRSCEAMRAELLDAKFVEGNPIPLAGDSLEVLQSWFGLLSAVEVREGLRR